MQQTLFIEKTYPPANLFMVMQTWLYDEGEDESKGVYVAKLDQLRAAGEPIARRALEATARPAAANSLAATVERLKAAATSSDHKLAHIPQAEKDQARRFS